MTESQKNMLILAAKAAGYKLDHYYTDRLVSARRGIILCRGQLPGDATLWNPYEDDAQCLQLARRLGITIDYHYKCAWKQVRDDVLQAYWTDRHHATDREAIVACAAKMGEML